MFACLLQKQRLEKKDSISLDLIDKINVGFLNHHQDLFHSNKSRNRQLFYTERKSQNMQGGNMDLGFQIPKDFFGFYLKKIFWNLKSQIHFFSLIDIPWIQSSRI